MHEPVDPRLLEQHREDVLCEVQTNRLAEEELRAYRQGRSDRTSALVWELERYAGRLLKRSRLRRHNG